MSSASARAATIPAKVASICGIDPGEIESLAQAVRDDSTRLDPRQLRLAAGARRRHGDAQYRLLAGARRRVSRRGGRRHALDRRAILRSTIKRCRAPTSWPGARRAPSTCRPSAARSRRPAPPIRALIVYNSNPVAVAPDSTRVVRGFAREDLFTVVLEHFQTDTADYADIVLPATTQLEHLDVIKPYGHYYMVANNPAIRPLGEAKPNTEIFRLLAKAMGFSDPCFDDSDETIAQSAIAEDWDFKAVRAQGWKRIGASSGAARFADGGFDTPSGKVEFFSQAAAQSQGLDALPDYIPPLEDTRSELARRFPLAMISPPARNFLN